MIISHCYLTFTQLPVKYQESSIGFENLAHLPSIENKCNYLLVVKRFGTTLALTILYDGEL